jgi:hypothetical protein
MSSISRPANANFSNANGTQSHEGADSSYLQVCEVESIVITQEAELEAPDPNSLWGHPADGMDLSPASSYGASMGAGGRFESPTTPESTTPQSSGSDGVDKQPEEGLAGGVEFGVSAQLFLGFSAKVGMMAAGDGVGLTLSVAGRAGWAAGASAGFNGVITPDARGLQSYSGPSIGVSVEAGVASAGVSRNLGNNGPEGPTTYTVSPPIGSVGVMVGTTSELGYTVVVPGAQTADEIDAVMRVLN